MAFLSLVPVVGTALVGAPLVVYCVLTGAVWKGIILLAICIVEMATVDNLVKPIFMRRGAEIDTLWIFLSVLGGIGVFGFLGLFLGPFLVTLLLVLVETYKVEFRDELRGNEASCVVSRLIIYLNHPLPPPAAAGGAQRVVGTLGL